MKITIDFQIFKEPGNFLDFENAEKFYKANAHRVKGRLNALTQTAPSRKLKEGLRVNIINCGFMAHNIPIKSLWFELIRLNKDEATYGLTGVDYIPNHHNPEPGVGGSLSNYLIRD